MTRATTLPPEVESTDRSVLIEGRGLDKSYRRGPEEVHALRGASFELRRAEVVALMGPSGSGKTTLLNLICGWEEPEAGVLRWADGPDVPPATRPWSEIAIVPQDLGLIEELSVVENVELPLRLTGNLDRSGRERAMALLRAFGLDRYADRAPGEVSLGEQQRVAVSRALIVVPALILADEPTGHQDAGWAGTVFRAFRWAARRGSTSLVATHSAEFLRFADRVLAIRDGEINRAEVGQMGPGAQSEEG
jgi:putative ABC transport system ATP-binding protein